MSGTQLLLAGLIGSLVAAALLASIPTFEPTRHGWLSRFGWILLRYLLPLGLMIAVISFFLLRH